MDFRFKLCARVRLDGGDSFHLGTFADSGGLELDSSYLDMVIILVIFFISCVTVVGICFILMFVTYKVVKSKRKGGFGHLLTPGKNYHGNLQLTLFSPGLEHHESSSSFQDLMPQLAQSLAQSPLTPR